MQRKPSFPGANCNIKMPDCLPNMEGGLNEDENEQQHIRQQLINFGHSQWGFNNWNWCVTKQDMDFVDFANGKYCVGVVAFVSITVKSLDLHRENIGYATSVASTKGMAIYKSRKGAVTNALRETLLSFGGSVATELMEATTDSERTEVNNAVNPAPESTPEAAPGPRPTEPKNLPLPATRKDLNGGGVRVGAPPPVARAQPIPVNLPSMPRVSPGAMPSPVTAPSVLTPVGASIPAPIIAHGVGPRNQTDAVNAGLESMSEEEARAERKRRQRLAQEEFRQKQMLKQTGASDDRQDVSTGSSSFDRILMDIPSQDLDVVEAGRSVADGKRKSPVLDESSAKRRATTIAQNCIK